MKPKNIHLFLILMFYFVSNTSGDPRKEINPVKNGDVPINAAAIELYEKAESLNTSDQFRNSHEVIAYLEQAIQLAPDYGAAYNALGLVYFDRREFKKAVINFQESLAIGLNIHGGQHQIVMAGFNNLGVGLNAQGKYRKASENYQKALDIGLKILGANHPKVTTYMNNLASVWIKLGDVFKAIEYYENALAGEINTYGDQHQNVAATWKNIGIAWELVGGYQTAIEHYEKAYEIFKIKLGEDHPNTKDVEKYLDSLSWVRDV